MKRRLVFFFFLLAVVVCFAPPHAWAMPATVRQASPSTVDSIRRAAALEKQRLADSLQQNQDSLVMLYIGRPDANRPNRFADSLRKVLIVENGDFMRWITFANQLDKQLKPHDEKAARDRWIIVSVGLLFLFLGIVRAVFPNEVMSIIEAFYNDRLLLQINKEDTLYSSWPFIFLYILFGFVTGMYLYHYNLYYLGQGNADGIQTFVGISVFVIVLFIVKIAVTRFLGIVFDLQRAVREYVSILYLSYFNAALVFLPLILILSLIPREHMLWVIPWGLALVILLLIFRFVKTANNVLSTYRFSIFYLFMYLCCLEIAPVLILIKVLDN